MGRFSAAFVLSSLLALACQPADAGGAPAGDGLLRRRHRGNCGRPRPHQRPLDFLYFVQQWPGSVCDTRQSCCYPSEGKPPALFSVHGLWPNYFHGGYPQCCDSKAPFDPHAVDDLLPELEKIWDSLSCRGTDYSFWAHEWEKHGTCSEAEIGREHDYFSATIALFQKVNITGALAAAGIVPSDEEKYEVKDIMAAVRNGIGYDVQLNCNRGSNGRPQLLEVWTCIDTDGAKLIHCPIKEGKCPRKIFFPVFSDPRAGSASLAAAT